MRRISLGSAIVGAFLSLLLQGSQVQAQATRTWVSGVGDDINPCSRTAPCKTFAGAISKTAAAGEISVLDPGSYGAVTITKSISIVADGSEGAILGSLVNGIIVNAAATDIVSIRGLHIEGAGSGLNGIRFLAGAALNVSKCQIRGFRAAGATSGFGIAFQPSGASELFVTDTILSDNGTGSTGGGLLIKPTGSGSAKVTLNRVNAVNNIVGIRADGVGSTGGINVTVRDSVASGNTLAGIHSLSLGGGAVTAVMVDHTTSANNGTGILAEGTAASLRIGNSTITGNSVGMQSLSGAFLATYSNNNNNANGADGAGTPISQG